MQDAQELRLSDPVLFRHVFSAGMCDEDEMTELVGYALDVEVKGRVSIFNRGLDSDPDSPYHRELVTFYLSAPETDLVGGLPLSKDELGIPLVSTCVLIDVEREALGAREHPQTQGSTSIIIFTNDFDPFGCGRKRYFVGPDGSQVESWEAERPTDVCLCPCGARLEEAGESPLDAFLLYIAGSDSPEVTENDYVHRVLEQAAQEAKYPVYRWEHALYEQTRRRAIEEGKRAGYESGHADGFEDGKSAEITRRIYDELGCRGRQLKKLNERLVRAGRSELADRITRNEAELQRLFKEYAV